MTMFSRIAGAIKSGFEDITEVLAPTLRTPLEEFKHSWKQITDYVFFVDQSDEVMPVEQTDLPGHLRNMVAVLEAEEAYDNGDTGPCMEYMLQHNILQTAVTLGQGNFPPGMMKEVLGFQTNLLASICQQFIPHVNVYKPMNALVKTCGRRIGKDVGHDLALVNFLCGICGKIHRDGSLVDFFLQLPMPTIEGEKPPEPAGFPLLTSLMGLLTNDNEVIRERACEAFLVCMTVDSPTAIGIITRYTNACDFLVEHLVSLYAKLPLQAEEADQETLYRLGKFSDTYTETWRTFSKKLNISLPAETQVFLEFLAWLQFCDEIAHSADIALGRAISTAFLDKFLLPVVGPLLTQPPEFVNIMTTNYVNTCLTQITSESLRGAFVTFLVGSEGYDNAVVPSEQEEGAAATGAAGTDSDRAQSSRVCKLLISRCDDLSEELGAATLLMFQRLLEGCSEQTLVCLILRHLREDIVTDEGDADEQDDDVSDIQHTVNGLLAVVPAELKSDTEWTTYREYFADAQDQVVDCFDACHGWKGFSPAGTAAADASSARAYTASPSLQPSFSTDSLGDPPAFQGDDVEPWARPRVVYSCAGSPFMRVITQRLERLFEQPHHINLIVTAILACLLRYPHLGLHHYLLGPAKDSPMHILRKLGGELEARAKRINDAALRVKETRLSLTSARAQPTVTHANFLRAVIVLEEFCKELAAIALVKANVQLTQT